MRINNIRRIQFAGKITGTDEFAISKAPFLFTEGKGRGRETLSL